MSMDDIFFAVYVVNMAWSLSLFILMIYLGTLDLIFTRNCQKEHTSVEHQLWAASAMAALFGIIWSLIEIFLSGVEGGWRIFSMWPFFMCATIALQRGGLRVYSHRTLVRRGECQ